MNAHAKLPSEPKARKNVPIATGVVDYFPDALAAVAELSKKGNDQHNPGTPLHWDRSKSTDEADALMRHFVERGTLDSDGIRHSAKVAWRALALLQKEIEAERLAGPPNYMYGADYVFCDPRTPQQAADDALTAWRAETRQDARDTAMRDINAVGAYREQKFGFTEGETVRLRYGIASLRGEVVGFSRMTIEVLWDGDTHPVSVMPSDLEHCA